MFANTSMGSENMGFPDVCLTPIPTPAGPIPTPLPYPNMSSTLMGIALPTVLVDFMPAHNMLSIVPMSEGDTTGILGGVACGLCMGPTIPVLGTFTTLVNCAPGTRLTTVNIQNISNCPGVTLTPSQVTTMYVGA